MEFFDYSEFEKYYYSSSKYAKKEQLSYDFHTVWWKTFGTSYGFNNYCSFNEVSSRWTAPNKKTIKIKLQGIGHSSQSIDSFYKCFTQWLNAHK